MSDAPERAGGTWTDSHCHVHDETDPAIQLQRALEAGVDRVVLVGTGVDSSRRAHALAEVSGPQCWSTVGVHPHDAATGTADIAALLGELAPTTGSHRPGSVVAVGECGLDYYYEHSPRDAQAAAFAEQIALAKLHDLALVVHTRDAWDDTIAILSAEGPPERTVIHCFSGGVTEAKRCLELGAFLSFSGIVTFKNAGDLREAATFCPTASMLVETDAPYLAPVPHRGARNEPAYVAFVGAAIAELRSVDAAELAAVTRSNTERAFQLGP